MRTSPRLPHREGTPRKQTSRGQRESLKSISPRNEKKLLRCPKPHLLLGETVTLCPGDSLPRSGRRQRRNQVTQDMGTPGTAIQEIIHSVLFSCEHEKIERTCYILFRPGEYRVLFSWNCLFLKKRCVNSDSWVSLVEKRVSASSSKLKPLTQFVCSLWLDKDHNETLSDQSMHQSASYLDFQPIPSPSSST